MKALFIAAGPLSWASSRYRAWWTAEALQKMGYEARCEQFHDVISVPEAFRGYDYYIWQKNIEPELVDQLGGIHFWDACDPAWWFDPDYARTAVEHTTAAVCSNPALADDLREWAACKMYPVHTIPDRFDFGHITHRREHKDVTPVRFIWFGIAVNRIALYGALTNLERLAANGYNIELTVCDDRPDVPFQITNAFPVYNTRWTLESEVEVISNHDIAILPPYPGPWSKVKSSNKADLANLCGLPAWDGMEYEIGRAFVADYDARIGPEITVWLELDIRESAKDWLKIFDENSSR